MLCYKFNYDIMMLFKKNLQWLYMQSINFYFHDAKERMRVAAKDLIGFRVCCSLLQQAYNTKIIKRNNEKKKEKIT